MSGYPGTLYRDPSLVSPLYQIYTDVHPCYSYDPSVPKPPKLDQHQSAWKLLFPPSSSNNFVQQSFRSRQNYLYLRDRPDTDISSEENRDALAEVDDRYTYFKIEARVGMPPRTLSVESSLLPDGINTPLTPEQSLEVQNVNKLMQVVGTVLGHTNISDAARQAAYGQIASKVSLAVRTGAWPEMTSGARAIADRALGIGVAPAAVVRMVGPGPLAGSSVGSGSLAGSDPSGSTPSGSGSGEDSERLADSVVIDDSSGDVVSEPVRRSIIRPGYESAPLPDGVRPDAGWSEDEHSVRALSEGAVADIRSRPESMLSIRQRIERFFNEQDVATMMNQRNLEEEAASASVSALPPPPLQGSMPVARSVGTAVPIPGNAPPGVPNGGLGSRHWGQAPDASRHSSPVRPYPARGGTRTSSSSTDSDGKDEKHGDGSDGEMVQEAMRYLNREYPQVHLFQRLTSSELREFGVTFPRNVAVFRISGMQGYSYLRVIQGQRPTFWRPGPGFGRPPSTPRAH